MILYVLLVSACLHVTIGRSIVDVDIDNDISANAHNDWVKLSETPKRHITKMHGQRLELECEAMGHPPPTIQWFKEDRLLTVPVNVSSCLFIDVLLRSKSKMKSHIQPNQVNTVVPESYNSY